MLSTLLTAVKRSEHWPALLLELELQRHRALRRGLLVCAAGQRSSSAVAKAAGSSCQSVSFGGEDEMVRHLARAGSGLTRICPDVRASSTCGFDDRLKTPRRLAGSAV
jgi:hypothetical protein